MALAQGSPDASQITTDAAKQPVNQANQAKIARIARKTLGYEQLRPGQAEAITALEHGRDTLAVMPTGSGKSAIYQLAGALRGGLTVVISPLLALQRDQVESVEDEGIGEVAVLNSTISEGERGAILKRLRHGGEGIGFLFLAPEQFNGDETLESLRAAKPALFVVDEAHCISEWGHDFRPDYLRLGSIVEALGRPPVLALTATASPPVREEIVERLGMRDPRVIVADFDRPNIFLAVEHVSDEQFQERRLVESVVEAEKPGIVYVATHRHAEEIAEKLREHGVTARAYHAGMKPTEREEAQAQFMDDEIAVIVSTTAFGMGVDKPNVRFVYHFDISDSLDSYYQEIGRAGRDGEVARAILFYRAQDMNIHRFFAGGGKIEPKQVARVARAALAHSEPVERKALAKETRLSQAKLTAALTRLEELGVIVSLPTGEIAPGPRRLAPNELKAIADEAVEEQEQHREFDRSRITMMQGYAEVQDCRRGYILNYFGEEFTPPCNNCDNCLAGIYTVENPADEPFPLNSQVIHPSFGEGIVTRYEGDKIVVLFDTVGYKTLSLDVVRENALLKPADEESLP